MSGATTPTPINMLAVELRRKLDQDAAFNQQFEQFIAGCDPAKVNVGTLRLTLADCEAATGRLAELYHLVVALTPYEDLVRAIAARSAGESQRGPSAAA